MKMLDIICKHSIKEYTGMLIQPKYLAVTQFSLWGHADNICPKPCIIMLLIAFLFPMRTTESWKVELDFSPEEDTATRFKANSQEKASHFSLWTRTPSLYMQTNKLALSKKSTWERKKKKNQCSNKIKPAPDALRNFWGHAEMSLCSLNS